MEKEDSTEGMQTQRIPSPGEKVSSTSAEDASTSKVEETNKDLSPKSEFSEMSLKNEQHTTTAASKPTETQKEDKQKETATPELQTTSHDPNICKLPETIKDNKEEITHLPQSPLNNIEEGTATVLASKSKEDTGIQRDPQPVSPKQVTTPEDALSSQVLGSRTAKESQSPDACFLAKEEPSEPVAASGLTSGTVPTDSEGSSPKSPVSASVGLKESYAVLGQSQPSDHSYSKDHQVETKDREEVRKPSEASLVIQSSDQGDSPVEVQRLTLSSEDRKIADRTETHRETASSASTFTTITYSSSTFSSTSHSYSSSASASVSTSRILDEEMPCQKPMDNFWSSSRHWCYFT